jgi:hypothetical protein
MAEELNRRAVERAADWMDQLAAKAGVSRDEMRAAMVAELAHKPEEPEEPEDDAEEPKAPRGRIR